MYSPGHMWEAVHVHMSPEGCLLRQVPTHSNSFGPFGSIPLLGSPSCWVDFWNIFLGGFLSLVRGLVQEALYVQS